MVIGFGTEEGNVLALGLRLGLELRFDHPIWRVNSQRDSQASRQLWAPYHTRRVNRNHLNIRTMNETESYIIFLLTINYTQLSDMIISSIYSAREHLCALLNVTSLNIIKMLIKTSVQTTDLLTISLNWMKVLIIMTQIFVIGFHESLDYRNHEAENQDPIIALGDRFPSTASIIIF